MPEEIKQQRLDRLMELQKQISLSKQQELVGTVIEVLVEGRDALKGTYRGRGKANAPDEVDGLVFFNSSRDIELGSFVQVKITAALPYDLIGEELVPVKL